MIHDLAPDRRAGRRSGRDRRYLPVLPNERNRSPHQLYLIVSVGTRIERGHRPSPRRRTHAPVRVARRVRVPEHDLDSPLEESGIRTSGPTLSEDAGAENIGKQMEDPARVAVVRGHRSQVICNTQNGRVHDFAAKSPWSKEAVDCQ